MFHTKFLRYQYCQCSIFFIISLGKEIIYKIISFPFVSDCLSLALFTVLSWPFISCVRTKNCVCLIVSKFSHFVNNFLCPNLGFHFASLFLHKNKNTKRIPFLNKVVSNKCLFIFITLEVRVEPLSHFTAFLSNFKFKGRWAKRIFLDHNCTWGTYSRVILCFDNWTTFTHE